MNLGELFHSGLKPFMLIFTVGLEDVGVRVEVEEPGGNKVLHNVTLIAELFVIRPFDFSEDKVDRFLHCGLVIPVDVF